MKLTLAVLFISVMQVAAENSYAQHKKLNLSLENVPLKHVLHTIEQQSEFTFMYNNSRIDVTQLVSVRASEQTIFQVLNLILQNTEIHYQVIEKQIVLLPRENPENKTPNEIEIKGQVIDEATQIPLPGVNVTLKGTTMGTITDMEGYYTLNVPNEESILTFSFIGYQNKEFKVGTQTVINVLLREKVESIDEVVVIGYGESSKKLLTSSVTSINSDEIEAVMSNGIEGSLQGKTAGVQVVQNSGTPGAAISVNIRGKSSISAGTQPLYVIDGVPMTTGDYGQIGFEGQGIDAAADINPNNIESISVLKDASAAAIYGARAGNGVILITTKSGKKNQTRIDYKSYYGVQEAWKKLDLLDAAQWKDFVASFDSTFAAGIDPSVNTSWQDSVLRVAPIMNHELSFSGGENKTRFYLSGRYFLQDGIVLGSSYEKWNGRMNIDHDITKFFKVGARIGTNYSINNRIVGDQTINGVLPNAISKPPIYGVRDEFGNYLEEGFWDNPVAIGNEVTNEARTFRNISNIFADVSFWNNFSFKNQWGVDYYNLNERRYEPTTVDRGAESNGIAISARTEVFKVTQQSTLKYFTTFGDNHNFDIMFGYSFERFNEGSNFIRANNFPSDQLEYIVSAGVVESASSNAFRDALVSYFSRAKYNYDDKYLLEMSVRRDGSSNFGSNNQYATLPAASFAWRISEESFLKGSSILSELKLKLSYGLTGNDQIGAFKSLNLYSSGYNYYGMPGIIPTQIPNPDLKWETTHNYNTGMDIALFDERISINFDLYYNKTVDLLLNRPLPGSTGFSSVSANVGALENKGLEFQLTTVNVDNVLSWVSSFNISMNRNKILELYKDQPITEVGRGNNAAITGQPIGVFFMYKSLGVDPSTGELVFEDVDKNGEINENDRQVVGDPNPVLTGGFTNVLNYRNFDFRFAFQFSYGNDIFNGTRQYAEAMKFGTSDNQLATVMDRWQKPGDETYIPRYNGTNNLLPSSHYIEDGSYIRLKEITLGYSFSKNLLESTKVVKSARLFVKAQNLLTFTAYSGMDPEVNYSGVNALSQGTDFFTFPQARTYSGGIKLTF